jgi:predicted dehydrogenase
MMICVGEHLACFVTGLELDELLAQLSTFVEGRQLDDDARILLRWKGGAKGMLWASQVPVGNENGPKLRVYGTKGGLEWAQENPNYLWFTSYGQPKQLLTRGGVGVSKEAGRVTACPPAIRKATSKVSQPSMLRQHAPSAPPVQATNQIRR